jgi:hypothetical protein
MLDTLHAQPVPAIDKRTSPLEFRDEISKVLGLATIIQLLHGSLGNNAAVVCVHDVLVSALLLWVYDLR